MKRKLEKDLICPLSKNTFCVTSKCAMFSDMHWRCSLLLIALSLHSIDESIRIKVFEGGQE